MGACESIQMDAVNLCFALAGQKSCLMLKDSEVRVVSDGLAGRVYRWIGPVTGKAHLLSIGNDCRHTDAGSVAIVNIELYYWAKALGQEIFKSNKFIIALRDR